VEVVVPQKRLTSISIASIRPPPPGRGGAIRQVDYWDKLDGGGSLGLRVSSNGVRTWVVVPRVLLGGARVKVRVTLGRFPAMSLADARAKAAEAFLVAARGKDPRDLVRQERQSRVDESRRTFGVLADEFLAKHVAGKLRGATGREYRRALKGDPVAAWQRRPAAEITRREVLDLLEATAETSPVWANRMLAYLRKFFGWCAERDVISTAPTDRVRPPAKEQSRARALSNDEVAEVCRAFDRQGGVFGALHKALLLTGQRRDEVAAMRWDEIKGLEGEAPTWELPGTRTKNHLPHVIPLVPAVAALLRGLPRLAGSPFVFTTTGATPASGFSRAKERVDTLIAQARRAAGIAEHIEPWVIHDLRRTVSTRMHEDVGIAPHIVEAVLNHVSGARAGVAGTYNRALYLDDKRRALAAWADHVERLVGPAESVSNVVQLRRSTGGRTAW
jgi:integrase